MLMPKRTKFRKQQRGRRAGLATRGNYIAFGEYGLQAQEVGWLTSRQIESARIAMTSYIKRGGKVWIRVFPDKPVTQKPAETRMGSGKGLPEYWVAVIKPGRVIFEMSGVSPALAQEAMRRGAAKLPMKAKFILREEGAVKEPDQPSHNEEFLRLSSLLTQFESSIKHADFDKCQTLDSQAESAIAALERLPYHMPPLSQLRNRFQILKKRKETRMENYLKMLTYESFNTLQTVARLTNEYVNPAGHTEIKLEVGIRVQSKQVQSKPEVMVPEVIRKRDRPHSFLLFAWSNDLRIESGPKVLDLYVTHETPAFVVFTLSPRPSMEEWQHTVNIDFFYQRHWMQKMVLQLEWREDTYRIQRMEV